MGNKITINSEAIKPVINSNETQIILQRHCSYDKTNGNLLNVSKTYQEELVLQFLKALEHQDLNNTYFLFLASNTVNLNSEFKRCVDSTNIAMDLIQSFLESKGVNKSYIINLDDNLNYDAQVKQTNNFSEPSMFVDRKGYLEFLKKKNNGMNEKFWIDFEEDRYKDVREELNAEGPDEIVARGVYYINVIQKFSRYFHIKKPNSKLIVWCGTHYDLISPLAKQTIFGYDKSDIINVDYCGGISLKIDELNNILANVNGHYYPIDFEGIKQHHQHL